MSRRSSPSLPPVIMKPSLDYLRKMDRLYHERPELKDLNKFGCQCLQELSAIVSIYRFGNLDVYQNLTGNLSRKTKKEIETFRLADKARQTNSITPEQTELFS